MSADRRITARRPRAPHGREAILEAHLVGTHAGGEARPDTDVDDALAETASDAPVGDGRAGTAGFARIELPDAEVRYRAGFLPPDDARILFEELEEEIEWERHRVRIRGREMACPRLSGWQGDATYSYSGLTLPPTLWTPRVTAVRRRIEAATGEAFNSVLANLYRDGNDRMGWHADDEPELGPAPVIASASFGAARRFLLRPKRGGARSVSVVLEAGSLLIMRGATQRHWLHSLPPTKRRVGPRLNLTFRRIIAG